MTFKSLIPIQALPFSLRDFLLHIYTIGLLYLVKFLNFNNYIFYVVQSIIEAFGEHRRGNVQTLTKLIKTCKPCMRITQDQDTPRVAKDR